MPPVAGLSAEEMSAANRAFRAALDARVYELLTKLGA